MSPIIPCDNRDDGEFAQVVADFAEALRTQAHRIGDHGLGEDEFYASGILRHAIEEIRGGYAAALRQKRGFMEAVLNHMQDRGFIADWDRLQDRPYGSRVTLPTGSIAVIEGKGCLDGNNTILFERPDYADEFVIWSICANRGSDLGKGVRSGIHTRLGVDLIVRRQAVDGVVVWDWACGTANRPCPKVAGGQRRRTTIGPYALPPPCIYVFPEQPPHVQRNPHAASRELDSVELLTALHECFMGTPEEVNLVEFLVEPRGGSIARRTSITRNGREAYRSQFSRVRRRQ